MHQTATKNYDLRFKDLVEEALDEANSDNAVWVSHESVSKNRKKRIKKLRDKIK